jgi:hypothetical protein
MKRLVLTGVLVAAIGSPALALAQGTGSKNSVATSGVETGSGGVLGTVVLPKGVRADGKPLPAGSYQIRLSSDAPPPVVGQSPDGARYVEFVQGGKVVAREVATVVSAQDIVAVAKEKPSPNSVKVQTLKGNDYLRVWINRGGSNYMIHLPKTT